MQEPSSRIPTYPDTTTYQDYLLRTGDCLYIKVYALNSDISEVLNGNESNNNLQLISTTSSVSDLFTYIVKPDGNINFPLIGEVAVLGKSTREVKHLLEKKLETFIATASVDIHIVRRYFSIIGAGVSGRYALSKDRVSIFEALAMAGDINIYGDRSRVRIVREINGKTEVKKFDIRSKDILHSEYYYIEPNDVIYIQSVNEQFFSMINFPTVLSATISTVSFGVLIYNYIVRQSKTR